MPASGAHMDAHATTARPARVLVVDTDSTMRALIEEWLVSAGNQVVGESPAGLNGQEAVDVAIIDVPYPRQGGLDRLRRLATEYPSTPILVLSATFFGGVACFGACAAALGVAGVLPMPVTREALVATVRRLALPSG